MDHMMFLFLIFLGTTILMTIAAKPFYIPTSNAQGFQFLHILTKTYFLFCVVLNNSQCNECEAVAHWSFFNWIFCFLQAKSIHIQFQISFHFLLGWVTLWVRWEKDSWVGLNPLGSLSNKWLFYSQSWCYLGLNTKTLFLQ